MPVVQHGGDLYVRSAHGPTNPWFRRARYDRYGPTIVGIGPVADAVTVRLLPHDD
jgi:hypothetical protein